VLGLLTVACSGCDQRTGCGGRNAPDDATVESVAGTLGLIVASLRLQESLRDQSIRDGLTGLFNRRYLEETLERELRRADRESLPLSVLVFDVDHFKSVNDTYGHEAGDEVLRTLAGLLQRNIRGGDVPCRFGGEEFVVILPGANLHVGHERAEHLRGTIAALRIATRAARLQVTVSVGVAMYSGDQAETGEDLLQAADRALYRAKQGGRNRVELAAPDSAGMPLLEAPAQSSSTTSP
jgi:diguanylate cyclase (GGDEF)-like protein